MAEIRKEFLNIYNIGYNFMFTEMQAAILAILQLKKLNKIINRKKKIFNFYKKNLKNITEISFIEKIPETEPVHWFTNITTKKKIKLKKYLMLNKIQTRDFFLPINQQPCFKKKKIY